MGIGTFSYPMEEQERDEKGQYKEKVSLDEILSIFNPREPLTATEVANYFEISNRAALNKLEALREKGVIRRKDVGSRAIVWWLDAENSNST